MFSKDIWLGGEALRNLFTNIFSFVGNKQDFVLDTGKLINDS